MRIFNLKPALIQGYLERYNRYIATLSRLTYSWGLRTVELTLNLVWLGIGAALLVLQITPSFVHAQKRRTGIALLALVCVICLLFPVVSITNDLNAGPVDTESGKVKSALLHHFLMASSVWTLVYDPHESAYRHEVNAQPDYQFPVYSFLSFRLTRCPPPHVVAS